VTLSVVPTVAVSGGMFDFARGPRIISLVLDRFNCMSFLAIQSRRFVKKWIISELEHCRCRASDKVESSTYLYTGHPVDKSSMSTKNERGPNQKL